MSATLIVMAPKIACLTGKMLIRDGFCLILINLLHVTHVVMATLALSSHSSVW